MILNVINVIHRLSVLLKHLTNLTQLTGHEESHISVQFDPALTTSIMLRLEFLEVIRTLLLLAFLKS